MELYQAHLLLRAAYCKSVGGNRYCQDAINASVGDKVACPIAYTYQLCAQCGSVLEAFTPLPITYGCACCRLSPSQGTQQYWILHSNLMFSIAKLPASSSAILLEALEQLYMLQARAIEREIIL